MKNTLFTIYLYFHILRLFEISETDSFFDIYFFLEIEWFQDLLNFQFLKEDHYDNIVKNTTDLFIPEVKIGHTKEVVSQTPDLVTVARRGLPVMEETLDRVQAREIYSGRENPMLLIIERRLKLTCSFDNIKNFPFGEQNCSMELALAGDARRQMILSIGQVRQEDSRQVGQYVVKDWNVDNEVINKKTGRRMVRVVMVLSRNIKSIFLVTFLPT